MAGSGVVARVRGTRCLPTALLGYSGFVVAEFSAWVAVLVYAYDRGGATESGLIALAQLVPAALAAPLLTAWASRFRPARVLRTASTGFFLALSVCALGAHLDEPLLVYGGAVVTALPIAVCRPTQFALLPELVRRPRDLAAGSVALGWADSFGVVGAGLLAGVVLTGAGAAWLLVATAGLAGASLLCTLPADRETRRATADAAPGEPGATSTEPPPAAPVPWRSARVLVVLLGVDGVLIAALDVLFVVLAVDVLEAGEGWAGYLQMVFGLGAVASAPLTARLVGHRLAPAVGAGALVTGVALVVTAPGPGLAVTVVAVTLAGAGRAVLAISCRTLLLRITPRGATGRVFGIVEGSMTAGLAGGSLLAPALVAAGGPEAALLGAGVLMPLAVAVTAARLVRVDAEAPDHDDALAAIREALPFSQLPPAALEELAGAAEATRFDEGAVLIREGDPGLDYHLITAGEVEVSQDGRAVRRLGPGDGVGEIALLRRSPRTATVTALTPVETLRLDAPAFLDAVTGHPATLTRLAQQVERWQPTAPTR